MTNVTDVKPLLTVATYLDKNEATEAYQEVAGAPFVVPGKTYTPLEAAPGGSSAGPKPELRMQTRGSKFVRFQEMKLQECAIEVRRTSPTTAEGSARLLLLSARSCSGQPFCLGTCSPHAVPVHCLSPKHACCQEFCAVSLSCCVPMSTDGPGHAVQPAHAHLPPLPLSAAPYVGCLHDHRCPRARHRAACTCTCAAA